MKKKVALLILTLMLTNSPAFSADDESGPQMLDSRISSPGPFQVGDRFTITLVMQDAGGSGVRNVQFLLKDKFGRQHSAENDNKLSYFSTPSFLCSGSNICEYPFIFKIDETWANNGFITFSSIRAFDMKTNGTYFYEDGSVEDLQTRKKSSSKHSLNGLALQLGTPPPTPTPTSTPKPTPSPTQETSGMADSPTYEQLTALDQQACQMFVKKMNSNFNRLDKFESIFPGDELISNFKSRWKLNSNLFTQSDCKIEKLDGVVRLNRDLGNGLNDEFLSLLDGLDAKKAAVDDKAAADKAAADKAAADKAAAKPVAKEKTIICLKGKSSLKVIGKNPKCPAGYKVKK